MNRLPPIEVSCISDGGKLCSYQLGPATNRTAEKAELLLLSLIRFHSDIYVSKTIYTITNEQRGRAEQGAPPPSPRVFPIQGVAY
jgi:hypothetical protein